MNTGWNCLDLMILRMMSNSPNGTNAELRSGTVASADDCSTKSSMRWRMSSALVDLSTANDSDAASSTTVLADATGASSVIPDDTAVLARAFGVLATVPASYTAGSSYCPRPTRYSVPTNEQLPRPACSNSIRLRRVTVVPYVSIKAVSVSCFLLLLILFVSFSFRVTLCATLNFNTLIVSRI